MRRLRGPLLVVLISTLAVVSSANQHAIAQFGSGRDDDEQVVENRPSEQPKAMIALTLWILKLSESHEEADPELTAKLAQRAENLSPVVGSISDVRELVGQMRVAGMLHTEREFRLVTLVGGTLEHQTGLHQPRIVATAIDPQQGQTNAIKYEPTGIKIKARAEIDAEGYVEASLEISESNVVKSEDVLIAISGEGGPLFADIITSREFSSTARVKNGGAVLLQSDSVIDTADPSRDAKQLIILGAAVVDSPD
ncbi:MAG TPA: hypothetical protein VGK58_10085 [Lacipirellulaceae bacterium]